jgi:predicted MPP superfamily phosphohydrolase
MRLTVMRQHAVRSAHQLGSTVRSWGARLGARVPERVRIGAAITGVALVGVLVGVALGGSARSEVGPFQLDIAVAPSWNGDSQLEIPPLGAIRVDSHDGPAKLTGRIELLDEARTRQLINNPAQIEAASDQAVDDVRNAIAWLGLRAGLAAVLGAALLGLIVFRSFRRMALTAAVGLSLVLGTVASAAATWNSASIREPHYEGLLTNVPAVIGDARTIYDRYGEYRGELIRIVTNLSRTYSNLSSLPAYQPDPNTVRVLHVSDLHLHPTSYEVIGAVVDQFGVNVVADTGDLTHWGSPVENSYVQNIGKLGVPYVFVRGNHDSPGTAAAVAAQPNAVVLDNAVRDVAGLTFAGIGDGSFTADKTGGEDTPGEDKAAATGTRLAETVTAYNAARGVGPSPSPTATPPAAPLATPAPTRSPGTPAAKTDGVDIMLVHSPTAGEQLADAGPLVLAGHTHQRKIHELDDDTRMMVEGSTGANAFRGIGSRDPSPLRMTLLYFSPEGELQAYDEITVSGAGQSKAELKRTLIAKD